MGNLEKLDWHLVKQLVKVFDSKANQN